MKKTIKLKSKKGSLLIGAIFLLLFIALGGSMVSLGLLEAAKQRKQSNEKKSLQLILQNLQAVISESRSCMWNLHFLSFATGSFGASNVKDLSQLSLNPTVRLEDYNGLDYVMISQPMLVENAADKSDVRFTLRPGLYLDPEGRVPEAGAEKINGWRIAYLGFPGPGTEPDPVNRPVIPYDGSVTTFTSNLLIRFERFKGPDADNLRFKYAFEREIPIIFDINPADPNDPRITGCRWDSAESPLVKSTDDNTIAEDTADSWAAENGPMDILINADYLDASFDADTGRAVSSVNSLNNNCALDSAKRSSASTDCDNFPE